MGKWNGWNGSALGRGRGIRGGPGTHTVFALTVFDDGSGPALYAGGYFAAAGCGATSNIAKWNGSSWSALGSGLNHCVCAVAVFDDGNGPALYAGGQFTVAGDVRSRRTA